MPQTFGTRAETVDPPAWWDDAEHFVVILPGLHGRHAETGIPWEYEPGESYPHPDDVHDEVTPEMWVRGSAGNKLAALDENYERLDRPRTTERLNEDIDGSAAITKFRNAHGVRFETVVQQTFECDECGREFDTRDALNGHTQVHKREASETAVDGDSALEGGDAADADEGRETASYAPDEVER